MAFSLTPLLHLLLACDKFKNCLSSLEVNEALIEGVKRAAAQKQSQITLESFRVSDGGEGFLAMVQQCVGTQNMPPILATAPDTQAISVPWVKQGSKAFIESADVIGHRCVSTPNPIAYTSYGLGAVLARIAQTNPDIQSIYVGLGSSAIVDGGLGALIALGARFYDAQGKVFSPDLLSLARLHTMTPPTIRLPALHWIADVNNPVQGPRGGLRVYGPQKGLCAQQLHALEHEMFSWWRLLFESGDPIKAKTSLDQWLDLPYGGAAGGVGWGLSAFYGGIWYGGAQWCIEHLGLASRLALSAGLVVGEGCFDRSSLEGKITGSLLALAKRLNKPVVGVFGQVEPEFKQKNLWAKEAYGDYSHAFKPQKAATRKWLLERGFDLFTAFEYTFEV